MPSFLACRLAMDEVLSRLNSIDARLLRIEEILQATQGSCSNMDKHIAFVENVYSAVRQPISYVSNRLWGSQPLPLKERSQNALAETRFPGV